MNHRTIFITGATSGIGLALAKEFAKQGDNLVLTGRRESRLHSIAAELKERGCRALPIVCDVTSDQEMDQAVATSLKEFGKIDVVIANAGFGVAGEFENLNLEDYRRQFETNVFGVLRTIYSTLNELKKTRGTLVLLGSISGYISLPGTSPYSMSKFAIHALASALQHELRPSGVTVVHIAPGFVESEFRRVDNQGILNPNAHDTVPRWLQMSAESAAKTIVKAVNRRKKERIITLHGEVAVFIKRHLPWLLDWIICCGLKGRPEPEKRAIE